MRLLQTRQLVLAEQCARDLLAFQERVQPTDSLLLPLRTLLRARLTPRSPLVHLYHGESAIRMVRFRKFQTLLLIRELLVDLPVDLRVVR